MSKKENMKNCDISWKKKRIKWWEKKKQINWTQKKYLCVWLNDELHINMKIAFIKWYLSDYI